MEKLISSLDPSLTDLVRSWESGDKQIRRPPNAFMLFGKDHRKSLARKHPNVNNKVISEILGREWKNAPHQIKEKYHENARFISYLHQKMFPGYRYSPVEARKKKSEKVKRSTEALRIARGGESSEETTRKEARLECQSPRRSVKRERNPREGDRFVFSDEVAVRAEYVPNNQEHFLQMIRNEETARESENQPVDTNLRGHDEVADSTEYVPNQEHFLQIILDEETSKDSENQAVDSSFRGHESSPSRSEGPLCCIPSYTMGPSSPYSSWKSPSPYFSRPEYRSGSTTSDFYENSAPPYHPYPNSQLVRSPLYCQMQDDSHKGPYYPPPHYRQSLGHYFEAFAMPYNENWGAGFYRQLKVPSQACDNKSPFQNPEAGGCLRGERSSNPCKSSTDGFSQPSYLTSFTQLASKEEMPNYFSQFQKPLKRICYGYPSTQTRTDYDSSSATQYDMITNFKEESGDSSFEIDVENETSNSCDSESDNESKITQESVYLINNELSQPTQVPLVSFAGLVSPAIQNLGMENKTITPYPSNSAINNAITNLDSKSDNEARTAIVVKEEMPNYFSQFPTNPNPLKTIHYGYASTQTRSVYDNSSATRYDMNTSFKTESSDNSLVIDDHYETSNTCHSEYEMAQDSSYLINSELSQPTQEHLVSFVGLVSSAIQNLAMKNESFTPPPSNSTTSNELINFDSKSDNETETATVVKEHEVEDIVDTVMHSNNRLNLSAIAPKPFDDQTNNMADSDAALNQ